MNRFALGIVMKKPFQADYYYHKAVRAASFIPVRSENTNEEYLIDVTTLGLDKAEFPTDDYNEPIREAAPLMLHGWDRGVFIPSELMLSLTDDASKRLFHWPSQAFGSFTAGHIIVLSENRFTATVDAVLQAREWLDNSRSHWFGCHGQPTEEYAQAYSDFFLKLFDDLRQVPGRKPTLIIEGSE